MAPPPDSKAGSDPPVSAEDAAGSDRDPLSKGEQTQKSILNAAVARFGRDGFRSSSVADIARDADVSGTLAYAYFDNKQALFLAALDHDAAGVIEHGVSALLATATDQAITAAWRDTLTLSLLEALERHPLAKRVLGGLEPEVMSRMAQLPALDELRVVVADRLRADQERGLVRADIDPVSMGSAIVTLHISLLISIVQFGVDGLELYGADVVRLVSAAVEPLPLDH